MCRVNVIVYFNPCCAFKGIPHSWVSPQGYNNTETIAFELEVKCVAGQAFRDIPMCKLGNSIILSPEDGQTLP